MMIRTCVGCIFCTLLLFTIFYVLIIIRVTDNIILNNFTKSISPITQNNASFVYKDKLQEKCETVHIAMVCAGYNSTTRLVTVVKSILFYRTKPLHFHLVVDEISRKTLEMLFFTWQVPNVEISFHKAEMWIPKVSWIPNKHYSGVYGLLKLILPEAIQEQKLLVFDTDITILADIFLLWQKFLYFNGKQSLGLVENQSDWYIRTWYFAQTPWPALGRGFNTGVMLMHLDNLRKDGFYDKWTMIAKETLNDIKETRLADQDIINAVIKREPEMLFEIDCTWNVQLSDHTLSESCYREHERMNILHWNSPRKQDVQIRNIEEFRKMRQVFLELDGNLLRRKLFNCVQNITEIRENRQDRCYKFTKGAFLLYRTHYFYLEYEYNIITDVDIVLATQCSIDRIQLLEELSQHWLGPMSVALYLSDSDVENFVQFIKDSEHLRFRKNIAYHIVYKEGEFYPINYLRNVAMKYTTSSHIFQLDIDFLPQNGLYEKLITYIQKLQLTDKDKIALIVPAFETQRYRFKFPQNKNEVLKALDRGILYTFRYHVWSQGHAPTNYTFWKNATELYEVNWEADFEPYVVISKNAPQYDTRFIGFGWNKVSHITHLTALGYRYFVLPDVFIIHRPHAPSRDIGKFRVDIVYRRCLRKLKDLFVKEIKEKFGADALLKQNASLRRTLSTK